jgi:hypothetical protein
MAERGALFWQSERFPDVQVVLVVQQVVEQNTAVELKAKKLASFPGHRYCLSDSPYMSAQVCIELRHAINYDILAREHVCSPCCAVGCQQ